MNIMLLINYKLKNILYNSGVNWSVFSVKIVLKRIASIIIIPLFHNGFKFQHYTIHCLLKRFGDTVLHKLHS